MVEPSWFRTIYVSTDICHHIGWGTIIYLAALSAIDPQLYEAARIDGANRWNQDDARHAAWHYPTWNLLIMRTFFVGLPNELEESGKIDGLSEIGIFFRIVLPLSKPVLATIGLYYAVGIWNNFMGPLLYLRDANLFPLQVFLCNIVLAGEMMNGEASAVTDLQIVGEALKYATILVSTVPILCVYPFIQKYFVRGALIGSVKG